MDLYLCLYAENYIEKVKPNNYKNSQISHLFTSFINSKERIRARRYATEKTFFTVLALIILLGKVAPCEITS